MTAPIRRMSLFEAMKIAEAGFARWAARHEKWARKIDGTPIPNDLIVNMAEEIAHAVSADADLLSALRGLVEAFEGYENVDAHLGVARAALAKAGAA
jgi:hypothetical protein